MNKIKRLTTTPITQINEDNYKNEKFQITTDNGETIICGLWYEKKTDEYHVKLPNGNPTGRTYIRLKHFKDKNEFVFETKTSHREGLSYGSWKDRMTDEEKATYEECLSKIKKIEEDCKSRKPKELTPEEKLKLEIEKLTKKLESLKNNK